ncbi:hypothetical protein DFH11DRAFT_1726264 [Phellopilus nigrolimitatus]|nr:hypothetical protein DFH11DRAFT_1726264 [Phellopilus nigrolimitatus]
MAKPKRQAPRQSRAKTPPPVKKYDSEARIPSQSHTETPYKRSSALNVKVEKTTPNLEKVKRIDILIECDMGDKIFHNVPELIEMKFSDAILKDGLITLRAQITGETALKLMDAIPDPGNAGTDVSAATRQLL